MAKTMSQAAGELVMLPTAKLRPHPQNPRRELGDLQELVSSIRQSGVLQNLTVVPDPEETGAYRVIIGHRRRAAAMVAGLTEVPCRIAEMTPEEQIATMLSENMQRNDLTLSEQVMGIRSLLDLVDEKTIAKETGLSRKMVAARASVARGLNQQDVRRAEIAGATLIDMINLSRLPKDRQNAVLEAAEEGKTGLNEAITREAERMARKARADEIRKAMWKLGIREYMASSDWPVKTGTGAMLDWQYVGYISPMDRKAEEELEEMARRAADSGALELALVGDIEQVYGSLYKGMPPKETRQKEDEAAARRERVQKGVQMLKVRMLEKWSRWILSGMWWGAVAGKVDKKAMVELAYRALTVDRYEKATLDGWVPGITREAALGAIGLDPEKVKPGEEWDVLYKNARWNALVLAGYVRLARGSTGLITWEGKHKADHELERTLAAVKAMGYVPEDWETQLLDGTHEVYGGELEVEP